MLAGDRNARRVNLRVARIGERRAALVGAVGRRDVAADGVRREEEDVAVAAGGEHDRVAANDSILPVTRWRMTMPRALPSTTTRSSISQRGNIFTLPSRDLPAQRLIRAEQELLAGLAAAVEGARSCAPPKERVSSSPPYSRANGTPCATHWSMMLTDTSASRWTLASRERKSPPLMVS